MKSLIQQAIHQALQVLYPTNMALLETPISVDYSREPGHGDLSSNVALLLSKPLKISAHLLAQKIIAVLIDGLMTTYVHLDKIEVAGPGFINFFFKAGNWYPVLSQILTQTSQYGTAQVDYDKKILVEFVSSNPTGPLHIGHGRAAAFGDTLVRLLKAAGYPVQAEYYVNDAGRQMDILSISLWLRYLEAEGETFCFPVNAYQGSYVREMAIQLKTARGRAFHHSASIIFQELPTSDIYPKFQVGDQSLFSVGEDRKVMHFEPADSKTRDIDLEQVMDRLIARAKLLLGPAAYQEILAFALHHILSDIQLDLIEFGVQFDYWFSEQSLITNGTVNQVIETLTKKGLTYKAEGNLWFRSSQFGDDKDRVLKRANGQLTYFAVDAAYHSNVLQTRGFSRKITILGADHHGYLARIQAIIIALGLQPDVLVFSVMQLVSLFRDKEKLSMSTRSGEFVTLRELRQEVGLDAARLFFVLRKANQPLEFDLTLAKSHSHENPIYYLQYAFARICSVMKQLISKGLSWNLTEGLTCVDQLTLGTEVELLKQLSRYPETLLQAATQYEPALFTHYLRELAQKFHSYYNETPLLTQEAHLRHARLTLLQAIKQIFKNGFDILGISAPDFM